MAVLLRPLAARRSRPSSAPPPGPRTTRGPPATPPPHKASGAATPVSVLAPTPYMGWDTYFAFGSHYNEATILEQASQMRTRGLSRDGYDYLWLDVGWWQGTRNAAGEITVSPSQWPHGMAWLTRTLHEAGLKVGLYTDAGTNGCGGKGQGSYGHYQQDVNTFAKWGFDAVKVDFCGGIQQGLTRRARTRNSTKRSRTTPATARCCCRCATTCSPASTKAKCRRSKTRPSTHTRSGRASATAGAPTPTWACRGTWNSARCCATSTRTPPSPEAAGPGHWNDPDYLGPDQGMSAAQFRTQFSMWAMLAAPLMVSEDLISMSSATHTTVSQQGSDRDRPGPRRPAGPPALLQRLGRGVGQAAGQRHARGGAAEPLLENARDRDHRRRSGNADRRSAYQLRNVWTGAVTSTTGGIGASVPGESTVLLGVSTAAQAIEAVPKRWG